MAFTFELKYVQFLLFYICTFSFEYAEKFLSLMILSLKDRGILMDVRISILGYL